MDPREWGRTRLFVEELEGREVLSPVVTVPTFPPYPQVPEGSFITLSGDPNNGGSSFGVTTPVSSTVTATLSTPFGIIDVDPLAAASFGVTVSGNGSPNVTLSGISSSVNSALQGPGFTFLAFPTYSGDAPISLFVVDQADSLTDTGSLTVHVTPSASSVFVAWDATSEIRLGNGPFRFPAEFLAISPWFDIDGSETLNLTIQLDAGDPRFSGAFTLRAGGTVVTPTNPGTWTFSAADPFALQALLDSVALVPPAGFSGRVALKAFGTQTDTAFFPSDGSTVTDSLPVYSATAELRFFASAAIASPPVTVPPGTTALDLGGRYSATDPSELPEDTYTLAILAPVGTLTFNPALVPSGLSVSTNSAGLALSGELADINQFLAQPGSVLFTIADPLFSGPVPLTLVLQNEPGVSAA
ncbi:MAG TPA: hypothetical protein VGE74_17625, partial [Gemmata sp.]